MGFPRDKSSLGGGGGITLQKEKFVIAEAERPFCFSANSYRKRIPNNFADTCLASYVFLKMTINILEIGSRLCLNRLNIWNTYSAIMEQNVKRITVKDIAQDLNIAQSTVSKALARKRGVSEEMQSLVAGAAARLGYQANRSAQALARNPIRIGVLFPDLWHSFYDPLEEGMRQALLGLRDYGITAEFRKSTSLHCEEELVREIDYFVSQEVNALILCPVYNTRFCASLDRLQEKNIKLLFVGTDIPGSSRTAALHVNAYKAGRLAAEFLSLILHESRQVAIFIGNKDMQEHSEKCRGFRDEIAGTGCTVEGIYETQDEPEIAYHLTKKVLKDLPGLGAIYVATGNSVAACRCLKDSGREGQIKVVATDIFPEIREYAAQGMIQGVIFQNPRKMGEKAIEVLYALLAEGKQPAEELFIEPALVLRNNLEDYA